MSARTLVQRLCGTSVWFFQRFLFDFKCKIFFFYATRQVSMADGLGNLKIFWICCCYPIGHTRARGVFRGGKLPTKAFQYRQVVESWETQYAVIKSDLKCLKPRAEKTFSGSAECVCWRGGLERHQQTSKLEWPSQDSRRSTPFTVAYVFVPLLEKCLLSASTEDTIKLNQIDRAYHEPNFHASTCFWEYLKMRKKTSPDTSTLQGGPSIKALNSVTAIRTLMLIWSWPSS